GKPLARLPRPPARSVARRGPSCLERAGRRERQNAQRSGHRERHEDETEQERLPERRLHPGSQGGPIPEIGGERPGEEKVRAEVEPISSGSGCGGFRAESRVAAGKLLTITLDTAPTAASPTPPR